ncbi:hypothetical protein VP758_005268 [Vibrio harveyi]|nr:hypothetical protein [Vibrio harveyi]
MKFNQNRAGENSIICDEDIDCIGLKNSYKASAHCIKYIEMLSNGKHKWVDISNERRFSHYRWFEDSMIITYIGNNIKIENGFGLWEQYSYECDYSLKEGGILALRLTVL